MLKEVINRARGQARIRVTCPYPERVLNLCSAPKPRILTSVSSMPFYPFASASRKTCPIMVMPRVMSSSDALE